MECDYFKRQDVRALLNVYIQCYPNQNIEGFFVILTKQYQNSSRQMNIQNCEENSRGRKKLKYPHCFQIFNIKPNNKVWCWWGALVEMMTHLRGILLYLAHIKYPKKLANIFYMIKI